jgi:hypothetical protein
MNMVAGFKYLKLVLEFNAGEKGGPLPQPGHMPARYGGATVGAGPRAV